jgi:hypothetical protein
MAQQNIHHFAPVFNLILSPADTETCEILAEVLALADRRPDLLAAIEADQDIHALEKKTMRLADKVWDAGTSALPGMKSRTASPEARTLACGRPRMDPLTVLLLVVLRGLSASLTDQGAVERLLDSQTLYIYFQNRGIKRPARSTILENVNAVRNETLDMILDAQLETARFEGLDDFSKITVDSTAVEADSAWPTDVALLCALLKRAGHNLRQLKFFGMPASNLPWFDTRMARVKALVFQINNTKGNGANRRRQHLYRNLLKRTGILIGQLESERDIRLADLQKLALRPSRKQRMLSRWNGICKDIQDAHRVSDQARRRVLEGEAIPNHEKLLSLADPAAAMIVKGQRDTVLGYKPTIARSGKGFACALHLLVGNPADAEALVPTVRQAIARTHICPVEVTGDDGYASTAGRDQVKGMGVKRVVLSGAKGKKIMGDEEWAQPETAAARRYRSAVESLMFTLKYTFEFDRMRRHGLQNIHAEMLEKLIAHNFRCTVRLRAVRREAAESQEKAA